MKLAARLFRRTVVTWKHSFLFVLLLCALTIAKVASGLNFSTAFPPAIALILGFLVTIIVGGWFFSSRATTSAGTLLGWSGALQLTALTYGLSLAALLPLFLLSNVLLSGSP